MKIKFLITALLCGAVINAAFAAEKSQIVRSAPLCMPAATARQHLNDLGSYWQVSIPDTFGEGKTLDWKQLSAQSAQNKLPFQSVRQKLNALQKRGVPSLLRLQAPEEWILAEAFGAQQTLIFRNEHDELIENKTLIMRYSGDAMICVPPLATSKISAVLSLENPVRIAPVTSIGGDSEIIAEVPVFNAGTMPLELKVASTSCGCTGAQMLPEQVAPGKTGTLTIHMHASDSRLVTVNLKSNDPARPNTIAAIQSQMPHVKISAPAPLSINTYVEQGATAQTVMQLPPNAEIISQQSTLPFLTATTSGQNATQNVTVQLSPQAPAGRFAGDVVFTLKNSPYTQIVLPVSGYISDDIIAEPSLLNLGEVVAGSVITKTVTLKAPKNKPFRVIGTTSRDAAITGTIDSTAETATHSVEIKIPISNGVGLLLKRVTVNFSDGRTLDVDIFGNIQAAR